MFSLHLSTYISISHSLSHIFYLYLLIIVPPFVPFPPVPPQQLPMYPGMGNIPAQRIQQQQQHQQIPLHQHQQMQQQQQQQQQQPQYPQHPLVIESPNPEMLNSSLAKEFDEMLNHLTGSRDSIKVAVRYISPPLLSTDTICLTL